MIPFPGDAVAALASGHFTITPQFRLVHPDLGLADLSDSLLSIDVTVSADNAAGQMQVTLARGDGATSLSPLVAGSTYNMGSRPLLDPNLNVFLGWSINGGSFTQMMSGRLDAIDVGGSKAEVTLRCRDEAGFYLNRTINTAAWVESASAESVISTVLQMGGFTGTEVTTPVTPDWTVNRYWQDNMSVMEALRRIAQQLGWDLRYFASTPGLRFYEPQRPVLVNIWPPGTFRIVTDATIGPDRYTDITELAWGDDDVRNWWEGWYADPVTGIQVGPRTATDADSMARYGLRYARIFIDRASNISTDAEMDRFLAAALADTKDPFASHRITMPFYPAVELNDLYNYTANNDEYDRDIQLAVAAYTHHWDSKPGSVATTTIGARANPVAAYREYRRSIPPKVIPTTVAPADSDYSPQGTLIFVTDSLLP